MIKFDNLEKACKELNFKLEKRKLLVAAIDDDNREVMFLSIDKPWDIGFYTSFDWLFPKEKEKLIKAITKDYEIAEKELEDAENNNM